MKELLFITSIILTFSCDHNKKQEPKKYFIEYFSQRNKNKTLSYNEVSNYILSNTKNIDSITFENCNEFITIKKFTNVPTSSIDGEFVAYYEKDIGFFFFKSLSWHNFYNLYTNNDSINKITIKLMGIILTHEKLYSSPLKEDGNISKQFKSPINED